MPSYEYVKEYIKNVKTELKILEKSLRIMIMVQWLVDNGYNFMCPQNWLQNKQNTIKN